jgi:hypothetical protein
MNWQEEDINKIYAKLELREEICHTKVNSKRIETNTKCLKLLNRRRILYIVLDILPVLGTKLITSMSLANGPIYKNDTKSWHSYMATCLLEVNYVGLTK